MQAFASVKYANNYMLTKPNKAKWEALLEDEKEAYLLEATRKIYAIKGFKFTPEIVSILAEIPDDLAQANCEVALNLIEIGNNNPHLINQQMGITSLSFGNDSVSYSENLNNGYFSSLFSGYAISLLDKYVVKAFRYV